MSFDLIIVGLGALGSSTLYHASNFSSNILGIDQNNPPHNKGSSHGESRIFRIANAEGDSYTKLALRSLALWKKLNLATVPDNISLYLQTGGFILVPERLKTAKNTMFSKTKSMADLHKVKHKILDHETLLSHFGNTLRLNERYAGYFEETICCLRPELCIKSQLELAIQNHVQINTNEKVIGYKKLSNGNIKVISNKESYETRYLLITAGAWINSLVDFKGQNPFRVYRQLSYWFRVSDSAICKFQPETFPICIIESLNGPFGCIPLMDNKNALKIIRLINEPAISAGRYFA